MPNVPEVTAPGEYGKTYYMLTEAQIAAILDYPTAQEGLFSDFFYVFPEVPGYYFADPSTIDFDE